MKKANTLRKNKDFNYCYRRGKRVNQSRFTLFFVTSKYNKRAGFSVSKKIGNAVVRNKVRRRFKEAFTMLLPKIKGNCSVIFLAREGIDEVPFWKLYETMEKSLIKANLIQP